MIDHKKVTKILSFILIVMIAFFIYNIYIIIDYGERRDNLEERWKIIEERLKEIESKVEQDGTDS